MTFVASLLLLVIVYQLSVLLGKIDAFREDIKDAKKLMVYLKETTP